MPSSDITKCDNEKCSRKSTCHRFTAPATMYQSYAHFEPEVDKFMEFYCEHFWQNRFQEVEETQ